MKSPGSATATNRSQPLTEKQQKKNACKINKQMHDKHIYQSQVITILNRTEKNNTYEQGKTQQGRPRSKSHTK